MKKNINKFIVNEGYEKNDIFFEGGSGSKVILNKKKFLDLSCCNGTLLLGHNNYILRDSLKKVIKNNISALSMPNTQAINFSKVLKTIIPSKKKFIFANSGTEAITKALRICYAISKKKTILSVSGSWHGSVDSLLFLAGKKLKPVPLSAGISKIHKNNIKFLPYNDIKKSKEIIEKFKKKACCVIVEPIQGCLPMEEAKNYLKFLRTITKRNKIILIFDELITGLRTDGGTLQNYFNIRPDISTFGKCFGGGLPIGIIGITNEIYKKISKKNKVFFGGTFSANSISTYVGMQTTKYILKNKKKIFPRLEKDSKYFQEEMNKFLNINNIKAKIFRFKSLLRIVYTDANVTNRAQRDFFETKKLNKINLIRKYLHSKNIYYPRNGLIFFSNSTSKKDINFFIKHLKAAFKKYFLN